MRFRYSVAMLACGVFAASAAAQQRCLKTAWAAFDKGTFLQAITAAQDCVTRFGQRAQMQQKDLQSKGGPPPTGEVLDLSVRQAILSHWAANDVGAAYWIIGKASMALYSKSKRPEDLTTARQAFTSATQLSYSRVWDPQNQSCCFWSPAEEAQSELGALASNQPVTPSRRRTPK